MPKPNQFSYLPNELINVIIEKIVFLPQKIKITLKYTGLSRDYKLNLKWLNGDPQQFPFKKELQEKIKEIKQSKNMVFRPYHHMTEFPRAFDGIIKELKEEFKGKFKIKNVGTRSMFNSNSSNNNNNSSNNNNNSSNNNNNRPPRPQTEMTLSQVFEIDNPNHVLKSVFNVRSTSRRFLGSVKRLENSKRQQNSKSKSKINSKNKSKSRN